MALISDGKNIFFTEENINSDYSNWVTASKDGQLAMPFIIPIGGIIGDIKKTIAHYNKRIEEAEHDYKTGQTVSWDSLKEEYGVSNRTARKSNARRSA